MANRLKLVSSAAGPVEATGKVQKKSLQPLQLAGLAVMVLGFAGRFLLPGVAVLPLLGIAGWAFFGGATATFNRILLVVSTVLVLAIAGLLYVLLPEAPGVSISLGVGYVGGLAAGWTLGRAKAS